METQALNDTLGQMDLIPVCRTFHPKAAEYTFFSNAHGTFSRIAHITFLVIFKKIESMSSIFSDHDAMRLEINYKKKTVKKHKHMEAKQYATK